MRKKTETPHEISVPRTSRRSFLALAASTVALGLLTVRGLLAQAGGDDAQREQLAATRDQLVKLKSLLTTGDDTAAVDEGLGRARDSLTLLRAKLLTPAR